MRTYDDWKTTDDTPQPERDEACPRCGERSSCECDSEGAFDEPSLLGIISENGDDSEPCHHPKGASECGNPTPCIFHAPTACGHCGGSGSEPIQRVNLRGQRWDDPPNCHKCGGTGSKR